MCVSACSTTEIRLNPTRQRDYIETRNGFVVLPDSSRRNSERLTLLDLKAGTLEGTAFLAVQRRLGALVLADGQAARQALQHLGRAGDLEAAAHADHLRQTEGHGWGLLNGSFRT